MAARRIGKLIGSWVAYWTILGIVKLGPAVLAMWRATQADEGQGNIAFSFGDGAFTLLVSERGQQTFAATASLLGVAGWVAVPPLLLWLVWATRGSRANDKTQRVGV